MRTNLKVVLAAVGVAALLASPAVARTVRHHNPSSVYIPNDARASVAPFGYGVRGEGGPYTPSGPSPEYGRSRDFQAPER
jgi:hypothetical protein